MLMKTIKHYDRIDTGDEVENKEIFYNWLNDLPWNGPGHKHERLIKDLRGRGFSWYQIEIVFSAMLEGPYGVSNYNSEWE